MKPKTFRVLMFENKDSGWWSAQCLDCDIAAQAKTLGDLIYEIQRVLTGHIVVSKELNIEPFTNLKPAPPIYWQMFDQAKIKLVRETPPFGIPMGQLSQVFARVAELQPA